MSGNSLIKVSVIIPVYNTAKFLDRLIESLINQSLKEMEFIFVNDGSTDHSLSILDKNAKIDKRIIVINKKNEGVSAARNTGLSKATGKFIGFVDSDDFVDENMYEILYEFAVEHHVDIVSCGYNFYRESGLTPMLNQRELIMNQEQAIQCLLQNQILGMSICNKLFKAECLSGVSFKKMYRCNEDRLFLFFALKNIKRIGIIRDTLYFYRVNMESFSRSQFQMAKLDGIAVSKELNQIVIKDFPQLEAESYADIMRTAYSILIMMYDDKAYRKFSDKHQMLKDIIKNADLSRVKKYCTSSIYIQLLGVKYCEPLLRCVKSLIIARKNRA